MTYFLASAFLFLLLTLHETHSFVSLSQWLGDLLGPEAAHQPGLGALQDEPQQEVALETYDYMTPPAPEEDGDNALIARSRRKGPKKPKKLMAKCFMCNSILPNWNFTVKTHGLLHAVYQMIPNDSLCYDAWNPSEPSAMRMRRRFRTHCYLDPTKTYVSHKQPIREPKRYDRGPLKAFGNYTGGCFKRFLDVGEELYTARGCRRYHPRFSSGYASQRFQSLEIMLRDQKDGCVSSPHASLTPFSRGVSLYVRYHVCVCSGSYCNHAPSASAPASALLLILTINLVI